MENIERLEKICLIVIFIIVMLSGIGTVIDVIKHSNDVCQRDPENIEYRYEIDGTTIISDAISQFESDTAILDDVLANPENYSDVTVHSARMVDSLVNVDTINPNMHIHRYLTK